MRVMTDKRHDSLVQRVVEAMPEGWEVHAPIQELNGRRGRFYRVEMIRSEQAKRPRR